MRNRLANVNNIFQGGDKRVLCVCSAGLLRSPTAARVLSNDPYNFNTRAAGVNQEYALIPVDEVLLTWADEIVCMEHNHSQSIKRMLDVAGIKRTIITLNIMDEYDYNNTELREQIARSYEIHNNSGEE